MTDTVDATIIARPMRPAPAATDGELDIRLAIKERKTVPFRIGGRHSRYPSGTVARQNPLSVELDARRDGPRRRVSRRFGAKPRI